jgi:hypothetical protein
MKKRGIKMESSRVQEQRMGYIRLQAEVRNGECEPLAKYLQRTEEEKIGQTYLQALGNKNLTARALGISRQTLYRKLKKYEIRIGVDPQEADERTPEQMQEEVDRQKKEDASREISKAVREMEESIRYIE